MRARLFTVPYFLVRAAGSAFLFMHQEGGRRGLGKALDLDDVTEK